MVLGPDGSNYSISQDTQMVGSDVDDMWWVSGVVDIQLYILNQAKFSLCFHLILVLLLSGAGENS